MKAVADIKKEVPDESVFRAAVIKRACILTNGLRNANEVPHEKGAETPLIDDQIRKEMAHFREKAKIGEIAGSCREKGEPEAGGGGGWWWRPG